MHCKIPVNLLRSTDGILWIKNIVWSFEQICGFEHLKLFVIQSGFNDPAPLWRIATFMNANKLRKTKAYTAISVYFSIYLLDTWQLFRYSRQTNIILTDRNVVHFGRNTSRRYIYCQILPSKPELMYTLPTENTETNKKQQKIIFRSFDKITISEHIYDSRL